MANSLSATIIRSASFKSAAAVGIDRETVCERSMPQYWAIETMDSGIGLPSSALTPAEEILAKGK